MTTSVQCREPGSLYENRVRGAARTRPTPPAISQAGQAAYRAQLSADPKPQPGLDRTKTLVIERPAREAVQTLSGPAPAAGGVRPRLDVPKAAAIEPATKRLVGPGSAPVMPGEGFVNPKVAPGRVKWHATLAEACAASGKSGKSILLFQMMGKLDDQFC